MTSEVVGLLTGGSAEVLFSLIVEIDVKRSHIIQNSFYPCFLTMISFSCPSVNSPEIRKIYPYFA